VVKLQDTKPVIFEVFVHWLYYQRFPNLDSGDDADLVREWGTSEKRDPLMMNLVKLYILGDQHVIPKLQEDALDSLHRHVQGPCTTTPGDVEISLAFRWLRPSTPLCRYLIDVSIYYDCCEKDGTTPYEMDGTEKYPAEFLLGIARRATQVIGGIRWQEKNIRDFELDICDYHEHKDNEEKEACKKDRKGPGLANVP